MPNFKKAAAEKPGGDWWIKADSCDLSTGLMESVEGKWHGDVDLNDGQLTRLYKTYKERQQLCLELGLKEPRTIFNTELQAENIRNEVIKSDMAFISEGSYIIYVSINFAFQLLCRVTTSTRCLSKPT